jgi:DNA phosphorothioation-associated putative methyltransferase
LPLGDGVLTSRGTFQKFFTQDELRRWVEDTLATETVAAGPGVFYVFRSDRLREQHLSRGIRRVAPSRRAIPPTELLDGNRDLLDPLYSFLVERGRLPVAGELEQEPGIRSKFGSLARAVRLLRRVTDAGPWEAAAVNRQRDLLVYLALGGFRRRPQFSALPRDLQADIKGFFGSYKNATGLGTELLFAAGQQRAVSEESAQSPVGKLLPDALYVHVDAVPELPVLLRVYEGCARTLLGDVPGATIVKLRRDKPKVSYLCYPTFEEDPHPVLSETFVERCAPIIATTGAAPTSRFSTGRSVSLAPRILRDTPSPHCRRRSNRQDFSRARMTSARKPDGARVWKKGATGSWGIRSRNSNRGCYEAASFAPMSPGHPGLPAVPETRLETEQ